MGNVFEIGLAFLLTQSKRTYPTDSLPMKRTNACDRVETPPADARMIGRRIIDDPTFHQASRALLSARVRAQLVQKTVAHRMGTTASAISRLENAAGHPPTLTTLERYALAVGCRVEIRAGSAGPTGPIDAPRGRLRAARNRRRPGSPRALTDRCRQSVAVLRWLRRRVHCAMSCAAARMLPRRRAQTAFRRRCVA